MIEKMHVDEAVRLLMGSTDTTGFFLVRALKIRKVELAELFDEIRKRGYLVCKYGNTYYIDGKIVHAQIRDKKSEGALIPWAQTNGIGGSWAGK